MKIAINVVGVKDVFAGIGNLALHGFDALANITPEDKYYIYVADKMKHKYIYTSENIFVIPVKLFKNSIVSRIIWDQLIFPFILLKKQYDLLISLINVACMFSPIKQYTMINDMADKNMPERFSFFKRLYLGFSYFYTLKISKKIITISKSSKNDILKYYPDTKIDVNVVPLGFKRINLNLDNSLKIDFINKLNAKPYLLFVSTFEPGKNLLRLLEAFKIFNEKEKKYNLFLVGSKGSFYKEIIYKINNLEITDSVKCLGYVSENELHCLYKNAKAFVFPSLYEGFGLPILEAMQYTIPILTSNVSSMPEIAGKKAIFCNPLDIDTIVDGINEVLIIKKSDLKKSYGVLLSEFTWNNFAITFKEIIKNNLQ